MPRQTPANTVFAVAIHNQIDLGLAPFPARVLDQAAQEQARALVLEHLVARPAACVPGYSIPHLKAYNSVIVGTGIVGTFGLTARLCAEGRRLVDRASGASQTSAVVRFAKDPDEDTGGQHGLSSRISSIRA